MCEADYEVFGTALSAGAAGALVSLVGRNEGGKTLNHSSISAVLNHFGQFSDPTRSTRKDRAKQPAARLVPPAERVATIRNKLESFEDIADIREFTKLLTT